MIENPLYFKVMLVINKLFVPAHSSRPKPVGILSKSINLILIGFLLCISPSLKAIDTLQLSFSPSIITGNVGDTVSVNVIGKKFTNIAGIQFSMQFDTSKLKTWRIPAVPSASATIVNFNPGLVGIGASGNFNIKDTSGQIFVTYVSPSDPITLASNDTVLFTLRLVLKNNTNVGLAFTLNPVEAEVTYIENGNTTIYTPKFSCIGGSIVYYNATPIMATCNGGSPNNDAKIVISNHPKNSMYYQYSAGSTFNPNIAIPSTIQPLPTGETIVNIPNPATSLQYTVRLSGYYCANAYSDKTITLNSTNCGANGCTPPTYTASITPSTCNGTVSNNNGTITLSAFPTGATYQYSIGAAFNGGAAVPATRTTIPTNGVIVNNLPNPTVNTLYSVRVYGADSTCFTDKTLTLNAVNCSCVPPTYTASTTAPTCTGNFVNSDGKITLSGYGTGYKYRYGSGSTFNPAAATPAIPTVIPVGGEIASNIPNPTTTATYAVRVYTATDTTCFFDKTVTFNKVTCGSGCTNPTYNASTTTVTCNGTNPNSDGKITLSSFTTGNKYRYSTGITFNVATALPSTPTVIPTNGEIASTLANPSTTTDYTIRVYTAADTTCFTDKTVTLQHKNCQSTSGSLKFYVVNDSAYNGEQKCVDVKVDGMSKINGFQYSHNFDPTKLQFVKIEKTGTADSIPSLDGSSFNTTKANLGVITVAWINPPATGISRPDGTIMYRLCFNVVGAGGSTDTVKVSSNPNPAEATIDTIPSKSIIPIVSNGLFKILGTNTSSIGFGGSTETGTQNSIVCMKVAVTNFKNVTGMQYSMGWDTTKLQFSNINIPSSGGLNSFTSSNTNYVGKGKLSVSWIASDPVVGETLADNTTIYEVCFKLLGGNGSVSYVNFTDDPTVHEILTNTGEKTWAPTSGQLKVGSNASSNGFKFYSDTLTALTGDTVCFPVRVDNFTNIQGYQFNMGWDTSKVSFIKINYTNPQLLLPALTGSSFNLNFTNKGILTTNWIADDGVNGQTIPNGSILFYLCFKVKGLSGQSTLINYTNTPNEIEVLDKNGVIATTNFPGKLNIGSGPPPPSTDFKFYSDTLTALTGDTVCFPVRVDNFTNILGYQFSMGWDTAVASFVKISYPNPQLLLPSLTNSSFNFSFTNQGKLTTSWIADDATNGQTLPNNSILFYLCLKAKGSSGQSTLVSFTNNPLEIEVSDKSKIIPVITSPGKLNINNAPPPPLVATVGTVTNVSCNGGNNGSIAINVSGGKSPYTYTWSPSGSSNPATNLVAGNYSVTVKDANNSTIVLSNISVTQPAQPLTITGGTITDEINSGKNGSVNGITISGGTAAYNYLWNSVPAQSTLNLTNVGAGTYTITVTDNKQCTATKSFTIINTTNSNPVNLSVASKTNVSCFGGSNGAINLAVTGGTGNFNYKWDNTAASGQNPTGLKAGTYCVTVTSGTSASNICVTITEPTELVISSRSTAVTCFGFSNGGLELTVTGGTPQYTYLWNNGMNVPNPTGLGVGNYSVTVTDNLGCVKTTADLVVSSPNEIKENSKTITKVTCFGGNDGAIKIVVTGGKPPYKYAWTGTSNTTNNPTNLTAGTYTVTITDANNCTKTFSSYIVDQASEIQVSGTTSGIAPNGAISLTVSGGAGGYSYYWSGPCSFTSAQKDLSALKCGGDYFVTVTDASNCKKVAGPFNIVGVPLTVKETISHVKCFGENNGSIVLDVSGGIQPYTFVWNPNVSTTNSAIGLSAGTYTVSITENGLTQPTYIKTFTITGPTAALSVKLDTVIKTTGCSSSDGQIYITASGGVGKYTYQWNIGPGSLTTEDRIDIPLGYYKVVVTDENQCTAVLDKIAVGSNVKTGYSDLKITDVKCIGDKDGKIAMLIYGCPPYNLKWGNDATQMIVNSPNNNIQINDLAAGAYSITLTSSSDVNPLIINLNINTLSVGTTISGVTITNNTIPNSGCNGKITIDKITPAATYTYCWTDNTAITTKDRTGLCAGNYTLQIKNKYGCIVVDTTFTVGNSIATPLAASFKTTDLGCKNDNNGKIELTVNGGIKPYTFQWKDSNGNLISGNEVVQNLPAGTYSVTIYDSSIPINKIELSNITVKASSNLSATVSVTTTTATVTATGASGNITYKWSSPITSTSPTATGLTPETNYSVTISDNYCSVVMSFTTKCVLTASISVDKGVSCGNNNDGQATVGNIVGCVIPYTFKWDNNVTTATNTTLSAGSHSVTVSDANGSTVVLSAIIPGSTSMTVSFNTTKAGCDGAAIGSAEAIVSGGTAPYTYLWNIAGTNNKNTITNIVKGNYSLTITDNNGCSITGLAIVGDDCTETICFNSMGVFTPNNDGVNETLQFNLCDFESTYLQIFDRWGQKVHETRNFPAVNAWDGKKNSGDDAPDGGYFYVLEVVRQGKTESFKGSITLIR